MPTQFKLEDTQSALLDLLVAGLASYGEMVDVSPVSQRNFDAEGNLVAVPPAVLLLFETETPQPLGQDMTRTTYQMEQAFTLICGDTDLRSSAAESRSVLQLVSTVKNVVMGARLAITSDWKAEPIEYRGVDLFQVDQRATWYGVRFAVPCTAQFTGGS